MELGQSSRKSGSAKRILYILLAAIVVAGGVYLAPRFEWYAPSVTLTPDSEYLGLGTLTIEVAEKGTGLKSVIATLVAAGAEQSLAAENYDGRVMQKTINIALARNQPGVTEGPAVLRVSARDRSLWSFFRGNNTVIEKNVTIDLTPPTLELIADDAYINFGGSGFVVYKTSADTAVSGVKVGKHFFPGYKGPAKDRAAQVAFFAHPYDTPEKEKAVLVATDKAGNSRQIALSYTLKNVRYRKSTIAVSDDFIQSKVAPLLGGAQSSQDGAKEIFVKVNRELRKANEDKIREVCQKSSETLLWTRPFEQLANSKVEANFADERTYVYQGEEIDHAYHLGYDLAVTKRHPVGAANAGIVAFADDLGIYGNTVIIDHGLGLFTLYSHFSSIDVKVGEQVQQGQVVGKTGETGLAVGDHLHFATLLHGVPVLPLEWWDKKWIRDNIQPKLADAGFETLVEKEPAPRATSRSRRSSRR